MTVHFLNRNEVKQMIPAVRQEKILEILSNNEIVTVESLMNELQVSVSTLRRDLIKLEGEKKITLLHGGGVRLAPKTVELNIFTKLEMNKDAKERIARKAAGLVEDGDTIFLDPSSTTYLMIPFLAGKDITVLTNGISHINSWLRLISPASWWAVPSKKPPTPASALSRKPPCEPYISASAFWAPMVFP